MVISEKNVSDILVFDRALIKQNRERASHIFQDHDFLFRWSQTQLSHRLNDINRHFGTALHIGSRAPVMHGKIKNLVTLDMADGPAANIQASEEFLPIAPKSMDLIISNLNLHTVNDLPGTLLQIRNSLKDDGLFIASILGGETLYELRDVITQTELSLFGGVSPRIAPFADKPQMGDLLQRAGLALPVVDSDIITVTYDNVFKLLHDLRGMGESNALLKRNRTLPGKEFFFRVAETYQNKYAEHDGRIVASFEVIFLLGWAPHSSQQKPLRPGSADHSLADALDATEIKTGEKAIP